jgi:pyruvate/2-oxoacid:ferredoxin oxidoreductase alpha subunit
LGEKPLVVLTAGEGSDAAWFAAQDLMAALWTNSAHHVVEGATHQEMLDDREAAAAVTHAILDVVASVRESGPLVSPPVR